MKSVSLYELTTYTMVSTSIILLPIVLVFGVSMLDAATFLRDRREHFTFIERNQLDLPAEETDIVLPSVQLSVEVESVELDHDLARRKRAVEAFLGSNNGTTQSVPVTQQQTDGPQNSTIQQNQTSLEGESSRTNRSSVQSTTVNQTQSILMTQPLELNMTEATFQNSDEKPENQIDNIMEGLDEVHQMCTDILEETGIILNELEDLKKHQPSTLFTNCSVSLQ